MDAHNHLQKEHTVFVSGTSKKEQLLYLEYFRDYLI